MLQALLSRNARLPVTIAKYGGSRKLSARLIMSKNALNSIHTSFFKASRNVPPPFLINFAITSLDTDDKGHKGPPDSAIQRAKYINSKRSLKRKKKRSPPMLTLKSEKVVYA